MSHGPKISGVMECSSSFRARRRKHWTPVGRASYGFCSFGDEPERGELHTRQQSEAWRGCLGCGGTEGTYGSGGYGYRDEGRGPKLFSFPWVVRRNFT